MVCHRSTDGDILVAVRIPVADLSLQVAWYSLSFQLGMFDIYETFWQ